MISRRIALGVRYDGTRFHGWQSQSSEAELPTLQANVERAVGRVANHPINLTCAGRTDAGVHASSQIVHFDTQVDRTEKAWVFGANSNLPPEISVLWAKETPEDFHARYSATSRRYRYVLYNHDVKPAILRNFVGCYYRTLDVELMQEAANYLVGKHDFSSFRGAGCQSTSPIRNMLELSVHRQRRMVIIETCANAFLLHMVRNIVGSLIEVGVGARPPEWIKEVLESRDRRCAGVTIAPSGLYLVHVSYPDKYCLPQTPKGPFFLP